MTVKKQLHNLAELIDTRAEERGSAAFMLNAHNAAELSFQQLRDETQKLRENLDAIGLQPGD